MEVNIHHFTDTEVNNCFSIYHTSWITSGPKSNFICDNIPTKAILFFFGCSEVNSTWLITSELANQRSRKVLFTCVVYTNSQYRVILCIFSAPDPVEALQLGSKIFKSSSAPSKRNEWGILHISCWHVAVSHSRNWINKHHNYTVIHLRKHTLTPRLYKTRF